MSKATWKNYKWGAWLTLVFGFADIKVDILGTNEATGEPNHFGIIIHPYLAAEMLPGSNPDGTDPTFEQAKQLAQQMLANILSAAIAAFPETGPSLKL